MKQSGMQKITTVILTVVIASIAIVGASYAIKGYLNQARQNQEELPDIMDKDINWDKQLIGGDKDEGGCLIAAGYSWCEIKQKCLRTWEEPCLEEGAQELVESYLTENITELSPEKEVLGGKFYITKFNFTSPNRVVVDYEDGHIALQASALFTIEDGEVTVQKFSLLSVNGSSPENAGNSNPAIAELTMLFSEKYDIAPENIIVQINDDRGVYLRGGVKLSLDPDAAGGYFLAKMVDGKYKIVIDGNGQIDCALVSDFPVDMVSDCVEAE